MPEQTKPPERQRATDTELVQAMEIGMGQLAAALATFAVIGRELGMSFAPSVKADDEQPEAEGDASK